mgnify:CR=1 FL=1
MAVIKQDDLIQSVADALQFISYYHPVDFIQAMHEAYLREESPAARDSMAQILINSRMCATGHRPICQDTGIALVFLKVGMHVKWDATMSVTAMVNEGVRRAYLDPDNKLRASVLLDPAAHADRTYDLTGPEALSMEEVAQKISAVRGHPVRYLDETLDDAYASRAVYGAPPWQVDAWVSTYTAIASGDLARVSGDVEAVTGRPAQSFDEFLGAIA